MARLVPEDLDADSGFQFDGERSALDRRWCELASERGEFLAGPTGEGNVGGGDDRGLDFGLSFRESTRSADAEGSASAPLSHEGGGEPRGERDGSGHSGKGDERPVRGCVVVRDRGCGLLIAGRGVSGMPGRHRGAGLDDDGRRFSGCGHVGRGGRRGMSLGGRWRWVVDLGLGWKWRRRGRWREWRIADSGEVDRVAGKDQARATAGEGVGVDDQMHVVGDLGVGRRQRFAVSAIEPLGAEVPDVVAGFDDHGLAREPAGVAAGRGRGLVAGGLSARREHGHALGEGPPLVHATAGSRSADVQFEDLVSGAVESVREQPGGDRVGGVAASRNDLADQIGTFTVLVLNRVVSVVHGDCRGRSAGGLRGAMHAGERGGGEHGECGRGGDRGDRGRSQRVAHEPGEPSLWTSVDHDGYRARRGLSRWPGMAGPETQPRLADGG
ncbi:MAG: hypothetical protein FD127_1761 [Acidimicrobiaceae bacterium]|nr:MAG: hypothetical protein FD127_1761 [Acidimicrobiaceae bacterium]